MDSSEVTFDTKQLQRAQDDMAPSVRHNATSSGSRAAPFLSLFAFGFFIAAAAFFGYQQLFSTFADYDDEGYVMLSLQKTMQGSPLYTETYSQYGPAFFQVQAAIHSLFGLEITHDIFRWKTLCFWLLISSLAALLAWRLTKSNWLAIASFALAFVHLDRFCCEPGHPQELCGFYLVTTLLLTTFIKPSLSKLVPFAIGLILAAAVFTKVNFGVVLTLPVLIVFLMLLNHGLASRAATFCMVTAALLLVGLISFKCHFVYARCLLPYTIGLSLIASLVVAARYQIEYPRIQAKQFGFLAVGLVVGTGVVIVTALALGTSFAGLADGVVLQHIRFTNFYTAAPMSKLSVLAALAGLFMAYQVSHFKDTDSVKFFCRLILVGALFGVAGTGVFESWTFPTDGLQNRSMAGLLTSFAAGFAWVILVPDSFDESRQSQFLSRAILCTVAVFHPLIAYPIAGTQMALGSLPLLLVGVVALNDLQTGFIPKRVPFAETYPKVSFTAVLLVVAATTMVLRISNYTATRASYTAVNLPGATRLKLSNDRVDAIHSIVDRIKSDADTFIFAENTRNSFYFWTNVEPPTAFNATVWPYMLNSKQQTSIIDSLVDYDRVIVLRNRRSIEPPHDSPLFSWISDNCEFKTDDGMFKTWARKTTASNQPVDLNQNTLWQSE